ncbi:GGDEF domain-containing protein [Idiomarina aquatica]|uniref:GGDEF domain-containing protein n=1 Tax=Idiomarina aquatica TaxID=1327752 RepID=UPI003B8361A4
MTFRATVRAIKFWKIPPNCWKTPYAPVIWWRAGGGEEFLLLLPGTSIVQAREVAERIRKTIESYGWEQVIGDSLTVTASIGVAQLKSGETFNCAVKNADVALYKSKAAGRNLVMSYH